MATKRASGGGRKPRGEFTGKSSNLSTRITPEVRKALDHAATRNKRSLSQEVERRLRDSLREQGAGPYGSQTAGLAKLVCFMAEDIEGYTGKAWHEDAFTCRALRAAMNLLLGQLEHNRPVVIPDRIDRMRQQSPEQYSELTGRPLEEAKFICDWLRTPEGVGEPAARPIWGGLQRSELQLSDIDRITKGRIELIAIQKFLGLPKSKSKHMDQ